MHSHRLKPLVSTSMVYMFSSLYSIHLRVSHFIPPSDISSAFTVGHCHLEDTIVKLTKLSNDPELDCVFRSIHRFVQQRLSSTTRDTPTGNEEANFLDSLNRRALLFHDLQLKLRNEIAAAKIKWLRK